MRSVRRPLRRSAPFVPIRHLMGAELGVRRGLSILRRLVVSPDVPCRSGSLGILKTPQMVTPDCPCPQQCEGSRADHPQPFIHAPCAGEAIATPGEGSGSWPTRGARIHVSTYMEVEVTAQRDNGKAVLPGITGIGLSPNSACIYTPWTGKPS